MLVFSAMVSKIKRVCEWLLQGVEKFGISDTDPLNKQSSCMNVTTIDCVEERITTHWSKFTQTSSDP